MSIFQVASTTYWANEGGGWAGAGAFRVVEAPAAMTLPQDRLGHVLGNLDLSTEHIYLLFVEGGHPGAVSIKKRE